MPAFSDNMFRAELAANYDLMHRHRDYEQECSFADEVIQQYCPGTRAVLDVACGTGRHAVGMSRRGYAVTGIDASQDMLAVARENAGRAGQIIDFRCCDVGDLGAAGEYPAAYCLGYLLLYMTTHHDIRRFLSVVHEALRPGGVFLVDFITGWSLIEGISRDKFVYSDADKMILQFEQSSLKKRERLRHIEFYYVIDDRQGHVKTAHAEEDLRILFEDEVELLFSHCGFHRISCYSDYQLEPQDAQQPARISIVAGQKAGGG